MGKKAKIICLLFVAFLVVQAQILPTQVFAKEIISIYRLGAEYMTYINSDFKWRKAGAFFAVFPTVALPEYLPNILVSLSVPHKSIIDFSEFFTDDELREIIKFNRYKKGLEGKQITINSQLEVPAYSLNSETGKAIAELLFTREDYYVVMQNPLTGNNIYLSNIDYIKFPGVPLIPVPLPLK